MVKAAVIALATVVFSLLGPMLFRPVFEGSSTASAYAIIATWVATAFAALLPRKDWRAIPITIVLHASVFWVAAAAGYEGLYREIGDVPWLGRVGIGLAQGVFVASPLVFAWSFDAFREHFRRWTSTSPA